MNVGRLSSYGLDVVPNIMDSLIVQGLGRDVKPGAFIVVEQPDRARSIVGLCVGVSGGRFHVFWSGWL